MTLEDFCNIISCVYKIIHRIEKLNKCYGYFQYPLKSNGSIHSLMRKFENKNLKCHEFYIKNYK